MSLLAWSLVFLIIALVAGFLGFWFLAGVAALIAKILFAIFLIGFILILLFGM